MQYETGDVIQSNDEHSSPITVLISFIAKDGTESYVGIIAEEPPVLVVNAAPEPPVQGGDDVQFQA